MQEECGACFPSFLLQPLLKVGAGEPLGSTDSSALCSQKFHELPWDMNHTLGLEKPQNQNRQGLGASPPWGWAVGAVPEAPGAESLSAPSGGGNEGWQALDRP